MLIGTPNLKRCNERGVLIVALAHIYVFRYGRIETLSGFAHGIFLILISIFIMFEAIQRMYVHFQEK